ncbi:hypothetical protein [Anaeromyxobacter oryzisoli]|uniref:hypothetical protein n=1 Tax=Anaeromyxobacter oryzisoli TaxID=2925408 RepID=UPI001F58A730|nr:hypothetical protein [Anaeromyxobacter sp. SG63]
MSRSIFPEGVAVKGLPWCRDEVKILGPAALVARNLCTTHNSQLSPLDKAASGAWCGLAEFGEVSRVRAAIPRKWDRYTIRVDGLLLERWCLKVMCNLMPRALPRLGGWEPPGELVNRIFGREPLPKGAGVALLARLGEEHFNDARIQFEGVVRERSPLGARLQFRALALAVTWDRPVQEFIRPHSSAGVGEEAVFHMISYLHKEANVELRFRW